MLRIRIQLFNFDDDQDPDLDPTFTVMRIRIRILPFNLMWIRILPLTFFPDLGPPMLQNEPQRLPPFHFVADQDPDPAFHCVTDPDQDLT